jgi:glycosyltransferase involved in cell wall biosynthesis
MTGDAPLFTVFTPTFNRAAMLPDVYADLRAQTLGDFEWLIVDDGSTDGTGALVESWMAASPFPIRYSSQQNSGKHVALNRGVREARGRFIAILDSDDRCTPGSLAAFAAAWETIPPADRDRFSSVIALCCTPDGDIIGRPLPAPFVDASTLAEHLRYRGAGERWGVTRTDVLRRFPLPEIPGERFIAEGVAWNRMAREYKARFINQALQLKRFQPGGLTASIVAVRVRSPKGAMIYYTETMQPDVPASQRLRAAVNYVRFGLHAGTTVGRLIANAPNAALAALALVPGYAAARRDRRLLRSAAC